MHPKIVPSDFCIFFQYFGSFVTVGAPGTSPRCLSSLGIFLAIPTGPGDLQTESRGRSSFVIFDIIFGSFG